MLLKWSVEGKRRSRLRGTFQTPHIDHSSICTESSPSDPISAPRNSDDDQKPMVSKPLEVTGLGKSKINPQGLVSEEQAIILRDEKLLAASNPNPRQLSISMPPTPSSMRIKLPTPALTIENMALLNREFEVNPFDLLNFNSPKNDGSDSDESVDRGSTPREAYFPFEARRELTRNPSSQMTVIPLNVRPHG